MATGMLRNTLQQYKRDTDVVANWLATTAKNRGYNGDLTEPSSSSTAGPSNGHQNGEGGRPKGKARKQAQQPDSAAQPRYELPMKCFVPLARFIAGCVTPVVAVPAYFVQTLDRVIKVRSSFSGMLADAGEPTDEESDARHAFFVDVLKGVRTALQPIVLPTVRDDAFNTGSLRDSLPVSSKPAAPDTTSSNRFDRLKIYDTPEETAAPSADAKAPTTAGQLAPAQLQYTAEPEDNLEAALFAFDALMRDLRALRQCLSDQWGLYREGFLSLCAVSVATNTAIKLARGMEEEIAPLLERHGGVAKLLPMYYLARSHEAGHDLVSLFLGVAGPDRIDLDTYDIADETMYVAFLALEPFSRGVSPGGFQVYNGHFGWYDESRDMTRASNKVKMTQDQAALMEIFGEITLVNHALKGPYKLFTQDEFSLGVLSMIETKEIPLWLCLAGQVNLDILKGLQSAKNLDRPWEEMTKNNLQVRNSIELAIKQLGDVRLQSWPPEYDAVLLRIAERARFWEQDLCSKYRLQQGFPPERRPHVFLARHPWYCGLWVHELRTIFHEMGVRYVNAWGTVRYTCHLYHAALCEHVIPDTPRWEDIEILLTDQGRSTIFTGRKPTNPEEYFKNFSLCMGVSSTEFTPAERRRRGNGDPVASRAGPRGGFEELCPISMVFKGRHAIGNRDGPPSRSGLSTDDIKLILGEGGKFWFSPDPEHEGEVRINVQRDERYSPRARRIHAANKGKPRSNPAAPNGKELMDHGYRDHRGRKVVVVSSNTPMDLVCRLSMALMAEEREVAFNYFKLHSICLHALRMIRRTMDEDFRTWFRPDYIKDETQLPSLVGYIFNAAAGRAGETRKDRRLYLLEKASRSLATTILQSPAFYRGVSMDLEKLGIEDLGLGDIDTDEEEE